MQIGNFAYRISAARTTGGGWAKQPLLCRGVQGFVMPPHFFRLQGNIRENERPGTWEGPCRPIPRISLTGEGVHRPVNLNGSGGGRRAAKP